MQVKILAKQGADTTKLTIKVFPYIGEQNKYGQLCLWAPKNEKMRGWLIILNLEKGTVGRIFTYQVVY
ncbi:hypothetical protein HY768_07410 [candidate division TA06 bacterium]|uniref:Uncharacterized protein n=1 Tax=candidate division TA06 bacterium TaxID=2250710 RepID=A0A933IA60_UNCT6|nr:hypothetical protein [candidate division TA06 bacterium]